MSISLTNLKTDFDLLFADPSGNEIDDTQKTVLFNKALRDLQAETDIYGTIFEQDIDVFGDEYEYPAPSSFKATMDIIDRDDTNTHFKPATEKDFWRYKDQRPYTWADANRRETDYLLINAQTSAGSQIITDFEATTGWSGASGAGTITVDSVEKQNGSYSLNFDITAGTVAYVENSSLTSVDLSSHEDKSTLFLWVYLPTITNLTSIILRWGNDSSNYWSVTETDTFVKFGLVVGWNRLGFAWNGATETGTPSASTIDYVRATFNYSVAVTDTDFRLDYLVSRMPTRYKHTYYTPAMVKTAAGVYQNTFTANDDTSVMKNEHDDLLTTRALRWGYFLFREMGTVETLDGEYRKRLGELLSDKPSLKGQQTSTYYRRR